MASREFSTRRDRLAEVLRSQRVDALLVSAAPNIHYLSGFRGSNGMLVASRGGARLFTDPRYAIQAQEQADCAVEVVAGPLLAAVLQWIGGKRFRRLAFEPARTGYQSWKALSRELPAGSRLVEAEDWVERLRAVKSESEIALIRRSAACLGKAWEKALRRVRPGATERDIAAEIDYRMRKGGAEGTAFETIVAAGARSALPHARPSSQRTPVVGLLLMDMGAMWEGYASDMTRTVHLGPPPPKVKKLYAAVLEAQQAALAAVRAGVEAAKVDAAARKVLRRHKLESFFVHSTGHGLGLEIHEMPRLGKMELSRLETGMVITIEPGVYVEDFGGIRIEDTVVVGRDGCEILTAPSKELLAL